MARKLRIVTVSYVDDNFGDNLIRICFQSLLDVAMSDHGLTTDDYAISAMPLKRVDENLLASADAICFAGGGLFGLSYLNFYEYVDRITAIADRCGTPVIFSSMGLNNMGAKDSSVDAIADIIARRCVKAVAVRENLPLFEELGTGLAFEIQQVADPAVWTKYVYGMTDGVPDGSLGINVVRGGLFVANQRNWGLTSQMKYLGDLRELAEAAGQEVYFYTNGSLDDNNTLRFFAREYAIPTDQMVLPQTTREVVRAIASRSAIASIRMHSSIIAYSFDIPSVGLEWNDKLPYFYKAIGHAERVIPFKEWSAEKSFETLRQADAVRESDSGNRDYLMSTYTYIFGAIGQHVLRGRHSSAPSYDFPAVADALARRASVVDEDEFDLRVKLDKAERSYLGRFISIREKDARIREQTKQIAALSQEVEVVNGRVAALSREVDQLKNRVCDQKRELELRLTTRLARFVRSLLRMAPDGRPSPPSDS